MKKTVVMFSTYNMHAEYIIIVCPFFNDAFSYEGTYLPLGHLMAVSDILHWFIHVLSTLKYC